MSDPVSPLLFCILCESESNSPNNFEQFRTIWFPFLFEMQIEDKTFNCATSRQRNCVVFAGGAFYSCFVFSSDSFEGRPPGGWVVGVLGAPSSTHFPLFTPWSNLPNWVWFVRTMAKLGSYITTPPALHFIWFTHFRIKHITWLLLNFRLAQVQNPSLPRPVPQILWTLNWTACGLLHWVISIIGTRLQVANCDAFCQPPSAFPNSSFDDSLPVP